MNEAQDQAATLEKIRGDVRDFINALDRGYLACKDDSAFIDALRAHVPARTLDAPK